MIYRLPLIAVFLLLAAAPLYADDAEDAAVKAVEKLGGTVTRDEDDPARPVVAVSFVAAPLTDRGLKALAPLKHLRSLDLAACLGVTDAGLKDVAGLDALEELNLSYTGITDAGLKSLTTLKGLRSLSLVGTKVTEDGVAALRKVLPDCKITLPATLGRADAAAKGDKDLEGAWEAVTFIHGGKEEPQVPGMVLLSFRGDAMTLLVGDEVRKATITVDASGTPRTIDMAYDSGPDKGKTIRGLYVVKGDELRICHGGAGDERPTEIASREGGAYAVGVWRRIKK